MDAKLVQDSKLLPVIFLGIVVSLVLLESVHCLDNGLALTPPMGYNTWNAFGGDINEELLRQTADRMVDLGLAKAGYEYLNIDDGWQTNFRNSDGELVPDPAKFPSGIKALADYVHSKGLKLGIYSDAGLYTCMGLPASRHNEQRDAATFASWGIDYLKYDNCFHAPDDEVVQRYTTMRDAINATGRKIMFSMCEWGIADPWLWAKEVGNLWRTTRDISADLDSILRNLDENVGLAKFAGPGGWNDPDMLEVGNGPFRVSEEEAHFALWSIIKAPLLIGADLRKIKAPSLKVLLAKEVIAVNQDPLGVAGDLIWKQGPNEVYGAPLSGGGRAVVLLTRHAADGMYDKYTMHLDWERIGYEAGLKCTVRDLFAESDIDVLSGCVAVNVTAPGVRALRITPVEPQQGMEQWRPWHVKDVYSPPALSTPSSCSSTQQPGSTPIAAQQ